MLITLEPTFALQLQPYILIEDTCRIVLVPNTIFLAIFKFNYNVNYVKRKKHTSILRGKIDVWLHYYVFGKEGKMFEDRGIIPKCFNGLDSETIHLYNVNKKNVD